MWETWETVDLMDYPQVALDAPRPRKRVDRAYLASGPDGDPERVLVVERCDYEDKRGILDLSATGRYQRKTTELSLQEALLRNGFVPLEPDHGHKVLTARVEDSPWPIIYRLVREGLPDQEIVKQSGSTAAYRLPWMRRLRDEVPPPLAPYEPDLAGWSDDLRGGYCDCGNRQHPPQEWVDCPCIAVDWIRQRVIPSALFWYGMAEVLPRQ